MGKLSYDMIFTMETLGINYVDDKGEQLSTISLCHDILQLWQTTESSVVKKQCRKLINSLLVLNEQ